MQRHQTTNRTDYIKALYYLAVGPNPPTVARPGPPTAGSSRWSLLCTFGPFQLVSPYEQSGISNVKYGLSVTSLANGILLGSN